jgi:hypothetical protein
MGHETDWIMCSIRCHAYLNLASPPSLAWYRSESPLNLYYQQKFGLAQESLPFTRLRMVLHAAFPKDPFTPVSRDSHQV